LELSFPRGEAERRQLVVEERRMGETVAKPSQAQRRVLSWSRPDPLLSAQVVGADDHGVRPGGLEQTLIGFPLFLDAGSLRRGLQVEKLRPKEADPLRVVPLQRVHFLEQLQIGSQDDARTIPGGSRARRSGAQAAVAIAKFSDAQESLAQAFFRGRRIDDATFAVDDDR